MGESTPTARGTATGPFATAGTDTAEIHSSGATAFHASTTRADPTPTVNPETTALFALADQDTKEMLMTSSGVASWSHAAKALAAPTPSARPEVAVPSVNALSDIQVTRTPTVFSTLAPLILVVRMPSVKLRATRPSANAHRNTRVTHT